MTQEEMTPEEMKKAIMKEWTSDRRELKTLVSFTFLSINRLLCSPRNSNWVPIAIFFLILGIVLATYTSNAKIKKIQYDKDCEAIVNNTCNITIKFTEKMEGPVYFYYQLDNFFQNHRTYLNSKDLPQLKGENRSTSDIEESCRPVLKNSDLSRYGISTNLNGNPLDMTATANPCGLIASTFFNGETFSLELYFRSSLTNLGIALLQTIITFLDQA